MAEVIVGGSDSGRKKLAIIDGKSVFYRGYFAMKGLATSDGTPTGGVYGFATMALEVIKRLQPDYVCVAWDKPKTNIRKRLEMYPEYKAGRKPPPPDFYAQIPILQELLAAFGWPLYELDDYEADDIMGTLGVAAAKQDIETMLITSDLDMLQLVDPHIHVYALKTGLSNIELYSPKSFEAKYGIKATQFLDMKALKGDSSDNIPGVPGIGEKGALDLLKKYKTLDGVYDNLVLIKDSVRLKLEAGKDLAYLSKKLASIWTDAPITLNLEEVDGRTCDPTKVQEILQRLQFRSLVRQLPEVMKLQDNPIITTSPSFESTKLALIASDAQIAKLVFTNANLFVHSRCGGKHGHDPLVLLVNGDGKTTYAVDLKKVSRGAVARLFNGVKGLIGYDVKATLKMLINLDIPLPKVTHDLLIGAFLINSLQKPDFQGILLDELSTDEFIERGGEIIGISLGLFAQQAAELAKLPKVAELAKNIEFAVIPVIARMEYQGIALDTKYLGAMAEQLNDAISDLEQQIYGYADQEFNIASPSQLADILFSKLNLPAGNIKKGKTGYSTAASELLKLSAVHPIIEFISKFREVTKLKNTYVDTLPKLVDKNSRLHTTFNMTVAQTGRLSSVDPNLQNIPVKTDLGKQIRTAFLAGPGNVFVSADYSQFELRLAAYLSNDTRLIDMFNNDEDVHLATAAEVFNCAPADVTKTMRREAKVINFGIMYGVGAHGLVQQTSMSYGAAKDFIEKYFAIRPKLKQYIDSVKKQAKEEGFVETIFGRRRPTPDVNSANFIIRESAMRAAVNMPFQGSAADIMKLAMIAVQQKLDSTTTDTHILLQIHDSLVVETPKHQVEQVTKSIKEAMESACKLPIKLTVDTLTGKNWGEL